MSEWTIYHNPQCSKSRAAMQFLRDRGIEPQVIEYLKENPTENEIRRIIEALDGPPSALVRKNEELFKNLNFDLNSIEEIISQLAKHPRLLERPVVVRSHRAVIARPTEQLEKLF